ncbi:peptidylprolyl isomerase [Leucobacter tenebrionis]|uniref:peptidylprolyl isomerase n=1 Tax=Leucobacter tenebrionis TaxID=2873270 RepID=UPI001CA649BB|nr:peptidylprolyl isomerase [Leucobacter tenebrionis]QZY51984.1 peptidylprolyl isomerase [Leucobacter tenebrionis]
MLRRLVPATAAAALLLVGVTGCGAQQAAAADCEPALQPGALSDTVRVTGSFGEAPEVSVPDDIDALSSQRTVVERAGDRDRAVGDQALVGVNMAFFDAASGKPLYQSPAFADSAQSAEFLLVSQDAPNPLSDSLRCSAPGDRLVVALSPEDGAPFATQLGGDPNAALVGVIDVVSASPLAAQGAARGLPNGYPAVVTDHEGRPGIVLPPRNAPAGTSSAVRIEGDGAEVEADDSVIAQVLSVGWDGTVQTNSWNTGVMGLGNEEQIAQSGFTFRSELTGKKVGSQVVVVENESDSDAKVVVVDILGVG